MGSCRSRNGVRLWPLALAAAVLPCHAQDGRPLEVVTVIGDVAVENSVLMESGGRVELDRSGFARASAVDLGDLLARVPSVKVQTNSRGEQVFALRGSDQRQVALTLDGAPLVSAWDGQLDLSLLPSSAIDRIAITRGPASVLQGPNALAGAVNVISRRAADAGWNSALSVNWGPEWQGLDAFAGGVAGRHGLSAAAAWQELDGFEPGGEDELRAGTDSTARSALLGWTYSYGEQAVTGLTLLSVDNSKGVAPERGVADPRLWRYPLLQKTQLIWYGSHPLGESAIDYSLYLDRAEMRIDQYADAGFSSVIDSEDGRDRAGGGRVQWSRELAGTQRLTVGLNWSRSRHLFRERASGAAFSTFTQVLSQLGAEWTDARGPWSWLVGAAYERAENPDTGPFAESKASEDWAATAAVNYAFSPQLGLDFTLGRKTRFPSLREAYSGALGRFVPNPELEAETSLSAAAGLVGSHDRWMWELRGFGAETSDGIVRIALPDARFTRINEARSRIVGVEFAVDGEIAPRLHGRVEGTLLRARALSLDGSYDERLEYRPGISMGGELRVLLPSEWLLVAGGRYLAGEHGLVAGDSVPRRLPGYALWDLSLERRFGSTAAGRFSVVLRVDNVGDEFYQPQWGLPGPGRQWSIGLTWNR